MRARRRLVRRCSAILVASGLVLGACGDDATDDAGSAVAPDLSTTTTSDAEPEAPAERRFQDLPHACDLVEPAEVDELIGPADQDPVEGRALDGARYTQCFWDGHDGTTLVGVSVVDTPSRYEMHASVLPDHEQLDGLGDEALAAPGVSSETRGATGGRTVSVRLGELTVVVAVRHEGVTPVEAVRPLAEAVVSRLG